ncbi:hypothetical protein HY091_02470 [Candidatus Kaiserbacteria bacterium]|nr:hypothetical protein [Candidatus Kaiserbacteria bacterium]
MWNCRRLRKFIFNAVIFIAAVATIIGVYIGVQQLRLAVIQLNELNAKAQISITWDSLTPTLTLNPTISNPLSFAMIPRNIGANDTNHWEVVTIFCNGVNVLKHDSTWTSSPPGSGYLYFVSSTPLLHDQAIFDNKADSIGQFQITFSVKPSALPISIPLAAIQTSGQQTLPTGELVSFAIDSTASSSFEYSNFSDIFKTGCVENSTSRQ